MQMSCGSPHPSVRVDVALAFLGQWSSDYCITVEIDILFVEHHQPAGGQAPDDVTWGPNH